MYKTVGIVPCRAGSKRIPNKNIKLLADYPLIAYSIVASKMSKLIERTIVTTDSVEIAAIASIYGADEVVMRPPETASDSATDKDWVIHILEYLQKQNNYTPENIVHLRATSPLRAEGEIDKAISSLKEESTALRSVETNSEAVEKMFKLNGGYLSSAVGVEGEIYNLPNQSFETSYKANGQIDIIKTKTVINTNSLHGNKIQAFITEKSIDIDDLEDFEYAEYILKTKGSWILEFLRKKDYLYFKK